CAQIRPAPASCPKRPSPPADPDPSLPSFPNALVVRPPRSAAPPPSSASTQSPPSSRPTPRECSLPPLRAACRPPHRYCQNPPRRSPQFAILVLLAVIRRQPSRSAGTPILLSPLSVRIIPAWICVPPLSSTARRSWHSELAAPPETTVESPAL